MGDDPSYLLPRSPVGDVSAEWKEVSYEEAVVVEKVQGSQHDLVPALAEEVQGVYKVWHRRQGNI